MHLVTLLSLILTALCLRPALAQDSWNCTLLGATPRGAYRAIAVLGDLALVGNQGILEFVDIADPAAPRLLGTLATPGQIQTIALSDSMAYLADAMGGLRIVDVGDPRQPVELGVFPAAQAYDVAIDGGRAYLAAGEAGLVVVDVGDPAQPSQLGSYNVGGSAIAYGVAVLNNQVLVAWGSAGLRELDVSDPGQIQQTDMFPCWAIDVAVGGDHVLVADSECLRILDAEFLSQLGYTDDVYYCVQVACQGDLALVSSMLSSMAVVDISNPANPHVVFTAGAVAWGFACVALDGDRAFLSSEETGLRIYDVGDPAQAQALGSFATYAHALDVAIEDGRAYVADGDKGLRIFAVADPAHPTELATLGTPGYAMGVAVAGNRAYVADGSGGTRFIDVADPSHPAELGFYHALRDAVDVATCGNWVLPVHEFAGLRVLDVDDPTQPVVVWHEDGSRGGVVTVSGTRAFLGDILGRLSIYDVADPVHVQCLGHLDPSNLGISVSDIAVRDSLALVTVDVSGNNLGEGLYLVDIHDPDHPALMGQWFDHSARRVAVSGNRAYLATGGTLRILDIEDPAQPIEVGYYETANLVMHVAVSSGLIYLADGSGGLLILRDDSATAVDPARTLSPATCTLLPAAPNPFNPTTTLTYELSAPQEVSLRVYDVAGRLVRTLVDDPQAAGTHEVVFDGAGLSSGVYVAELRAGGATATRKLLLLK